MNNTLYTDRADAGRKLAIALDDFRNENPIILALPRGGVPVAYEIAKSFDAPLDVLFVRKIGTPMSPELAAGAVVDGRPPQLVLNEDVVKMYDIPDKYLQDRKKQMLEEIERRRALYRKEHQAIDIEGRTVILVDDGIATGSTVRAALKGLKLLLPKKLVLAVPVAPPDTMQKLQNEADDVICLATPSMFMAIGQFYTDFGQVPDERVVELLEQSESWQQTG